MPAANVKKCQKILYNKVVRIILHTLCAHYCIIISETPVRKPGDIYRHRRRLEMVFFDSLLSVLLCTREISRGFRLL